MYNKNENLNLLQSFQYLNYYNKDVSKGQFKLFL